MATLTADDIEDVRAITGDVCEPYDVSDEAMERLYESTDRANGSLDRLIVWVLRRRVGRTAKLIASSDPQLGTNNSANQHHDHLKALLKDWEKRTGMSADSSSLAVGELVLSIDTTEDDEE